jgi:hypothetical protein
MKILLFNIASLVLLMVLATSCKKQSSNSPRISTTIKFLLYTDKDFSHENNIISFNAFIENPVTKIIWDTLLPPMTIKDIPDRIHQLVFEKTVLSGNSLMKVGFRYSIENVGISWHIDSCKAGQSLKIVDFNFQ